MSYGTTARVKAKLGIDNADADTEIDDIRTDVSDLIDFYLSELEGTIPVTDTTKLKALNYATNVISHGEFELRHKKRDEQTGAFSIYNHGWSIFDKYLQLIHGKELKEMSSAKVALAQGDFRRHLQSRLLHLRDMPFWLTRG